MSKRYHFLPASLVGYYLENSFKKLLDENQQYDGVYWHISGKNGKRKHKILPGDICYIYYSNLPDLSSRILFGSKDKVTIAEKHFFFCSSSKLLNVSTEILSPFEYLSNASST